MPDQTSSQPPKVTAGTEEITDEPAGKLTIDSDGRAKSEPTEDVVDIAGKDGEGWQEQVNAWLRSGQFKTEIKSARRVGDKGDAFELIAAYSQAVHVDDSVSAIFADGSRLDGQVVSISACDVPGCNKYRLRRLVGLGNN